MAPERNPTENAVKLYKIALIEDSELFASIFSSSLTQFWPRHLGTARIQVCLSSRQLKELSTEPWDAIFLDYHWGELNALDVRSLLKAEGVEARRWYIVTQIEDLPPETRAVLEGMGFQILQKPSPRQTPELVNRIAGDIAMAA